ncbi:hypothetical protein F5Y13DRAFT_51717 [Hypoxylon sp. FL1857]|nr:hypothetical protein F5Y13DRAFT_51717 [Hypoxylon sp. FL1857]
MPPDGSLNGREKDWICYCNQLAPYILLAELDKDTGQPIPGTGTKLAICQNVKCGFIARWEDRGMAYRSHLMRELPRIGLPLAQQAAFENVATAGSGNHIGNTLILNLNRPFSFGDFLQNSAPVPIVQSETFDFATIIENSAAIRIQRERESLLRQILLIFNSL